MALERLPSAEEEMDAASVLMHVRRLIDKAMSGEQGDSVSYLPGRADACTAIRTMMKKAREDVRCVVSTTFFAEELASQTDGSNPPDLRDRLHIEVLCDPSVACSKVGSALLNTCSVSELRVARWSMPDLLLVDGATAFCHLPSAGREAVVLRGAGVVELLHAFYSGVWSAAHTFQIFERFGKLYNDTQTRKILNLLARGYKDDVAARQLGVSVRTYRRYVADLLRELDAESRFQGGVRAAQLGFMTAC